MTLPSASTDRALRIYLALAQYPILQTAIRARMRRELFQRGIITQTAFDAEVREQSIRSQAREAVNNPFADEAADIWEMRQMRVRDHLTDFYFAYNLPYELFEEIVRQSLAERGARPQDMMVSFNPELAPKDMLFEQAFSIEKLPPDERKQMEARLQEIKVVLIRTMISGQLGYVNIAKEWFSISDLNEIRWRKIGEGKIGGKSAGMLLAARILQSRVDKEIRENLVIPESYFLGTDVIYRFMTLNNLMQWGDQKYKSDEQIRADYPVIREEFLKYHLPPDATESLRDLLEHIGPQPLIVRSSSLLEDNFGTSFAGKYESYFCPNQGDLDQNLQDLSQAIIKIYASIFNPNALLYRRSKQLQDYDERMAILIQVVQGERMGRYYLPHAAGVAFSRNLYRWSPQIRREDGFVRMVWGLGTRAVDRVGSDYPRLVALSHPTLYPGSTPKMIHRYSQHFVDAIDLEENQFVTLPIEEVLSAHYPPLRYIVQVDDGGFYRQLRSTMLNNNLENLVITFDELFRRTSIADHMRTILQILEKEYRSPVDTEFTLQIENPHSMKPVVKFCLLQCRPQSHLKESRSRFPVNLDPKDVIFSTSRNVPQGYVEGIRQVLFVNPVCYYALPTQAMRTELGRVIGQLNTKLQGTSFILVGPGRWGTTNPDLGVPIGYADIYNTLALVEVSGPGIGPAPEPSFGTHFFQDLVEANIYPLAIYLEDDDAVLNRAFFYETPNHLFDSFPEIQERDPAFWDCLRLIEVDSFRPGHHIDLAMDDEQNQAVAFLRSD